MKVGSCLVDFDSRNLPEEKVGVLVIGSGAAGLTAALAAAEKRPVTLVVKSGFLDTATDLAQGGVAAAVGRGDSCRSHQADTIEAGAGLCDPEAVRVLAVEGAERVRELLDLGAQFTVDAGGRLVLAREGGHSRARILYASGDRSGAEIVRTLSPLVIKNRRIDIREGCFLVDLLVSGKSVVGALLYEKKKRSLLIVRASGVVLATGGLGQVFQETTNPAISTGDGISCAWRAGATLRDIEFIQFHPTALYVAGAPRFLISEAVRGEGAALVNIRGERFMRSYHPMGELAARDVVARAIIDQMKRWGTGNVFLDARKIGKKFPTRFPSINATVKRFRISPEKDLIPVRPVAHYTMGGIKTDLDGAAALENLYACGECACTGVHGANRLASNSLLECLVFGRRAGRAAAQNDAIGRGPLRVSRPSVHFKLDISDLRRSLNTLMWRRAGIERSGVDLEEAAVRIAQWEEYALRAQFDSPFEWECQNMLVLSGLIVSSALRRVESRGAHFRTDFPERHDREWQRHLDVTRGE